MASRRPFAVQKLELKESSPGKAVYDARLASADAELTGAATVEFDGFIWFDLTLAPKGKNLTLDAASLSWRSNQKPAFFSDAINSSKDTFLRRQTGEKWGPGAAPGFPHFRSLL